MFQLRANGPSLSLRAWLTCIVVLALVGGSLLTWLVLYESSSSPVATELVSGRLEIHSEPGVGTTARFELPLSEGASGDT